ncbi:MAG: site-specific DNA-methyltransferase [Bacteroidales bacterium]|jgi:DNA modification methylase|nr:site-specific DNA-methyltransferase [Bacteroidales bacterium]
MIDTDLLSIKEASVWATSYTKKDVTPSNIAYLVQYGLVRKIGENGSTQIVLHELKNYYDKFLISRETYFKQSIGRDLNWALSFEQYKEAETTKHVHRLHPYKGKFIPQLVEYFLDGHTDKFKTETYFEKGDIVLDPFAGSGTTLVEACELGINAVGVDISAFNSLIGNCKIAKYDIVDVKNEIDKITKSLEIFIKNSNVIKFEEKLSTALNAFNNQYFSVPDYKYCLRNGEINEKKYSTEKEKEFLSVYENLVKKYDIKLRQDDDKTFLDKWFSAHIRSEIDVVFNEIKKIKNPKTKNIIAIILSRTIRSCRATTHADLATLIEPVTTTYYCHKHGKICKPLFSIFKWWKTYSKDTVNRLLQFDKLRTKTYQLCLTGDSRSIDFFEEIEKRSEEFGKLLKSRKIKGIFSSPPYVGLIDYHEQHAYAYDLFGFERKDELEIGPLYKGQKREAQESYVQGVADVLNNCKRFFADDYSVFLVANDKYNLYPTIAEKAGMKIVNQFSRPVLNRSEKDKGAYSETVFYLKEKKA